MLHNVSHDHKLQAVAACPSRHKLLCNVATSSNSFQNWFISVYRIWVSYLNPIFWTVYGLIESQVDNLSSLVAMNNNTSVPAYEAVEILFGYQ